MLDGVEEVKGWPVKKVSWISFGVSLVSAHTGTIPTRRAPAATPAVRARIVYPPEDASEGSYDKSRGNVDGPGRSISPHRGDRKRSGQGQGPMQRSMPSLLR